MTHNLSHDNTPQGNDSGAPSQAHLRAATPPSFRACLKKSAMSEEGFVGALLQTSLSRLDTWTLPDLERLLAASLRHNLSPTGREIFLAPDPAGGAPLLVVGVDGWSRILNEHKQFAGMRFRESVKLVDGIPAWIECTMHRRDRRVQTAIREYLCEVRGTSSAWITHPSRMLRHKAMVQCARVAFGLSEIVDADEADRIATARQAQQGKTTQPTYTSERDYRRSPVGVAELKKILTTKEANRKTD